MLKEMTLIENETLFKILDFIENLTGYRIPDTNYNRMKKIITNNIEEKNITPLEYLHQLQNNSLEFESFINKATICETYFFREERHFKILERIILPEMKNQSIKILCTACSTGEEALSISMLINKHFSNINYSIYAVDINSESLKKFKSLEYTKTSLRHDGKNYHELISQYSAMFHNNIIVNFDLLKNIKIKRMNIYSNELDILPSDFDIIFFRNTLIYMNAENKKLMINKLANKLNNNGFLFLGSSEVPFITHETLTLQEYSNAYYFKKNNI